MAAKYSILIVEDVEEMSQLLNLVLQDIEGIKVSGIAKNGFEARLEMTRRRPDLVLLDEVLPGESSYDLLQEFLDLEIKVILMTSLEAPSHELPPGAQCRIVKPGWKSFEEDKIRLKKLIFDHLK